MSLTWGSIGHAFASGFSAIVKGEQYLANAITKIDSPKVQTTVENLTSLIPLYGKTGVAVEQVSFAALGIIAGGLHYIGDAFEKNLLDAGADQTAIDGIKQIITQFPSLIADVEAFFGQPKASAITKAPASTATQPVAVTSPQVHTV